MKIKDEIFKYFIRIKATVELLLTNLLLDFEIKVFLRSKFAFIKCMKNDSNHIVSLFFQRDTTF